MAGNDYSEQQGEVITSQERAALLLAQDVYGEQAKLAAVEFSEAVRLSEEQRDSLIGGLAIKLDQLDFEQRKEVADSLRAVAAVLTIATNGNGHRAQSQITIAEEFSADNQVYDEEPSLPEQEPLSKIQGKWLGKFMSDESVDEVKRLSVSQRIKFAARIGELYKEMPLLGKANQSKDNRVEQVVNFMSGKTQTEIAETQGITPSSVSSGLNSMAKILKDKLPPIQIAEVIGDISSEIEKEHEDQQEQVRLEQRNWYKKIFPDKLSMEILEDLTDAQKQYISRKLTELTKDPMIKKIGATKTNRRILEMELLINDHDAASISGIVSRPLADVKKELHETAILIRNRVPTNELREILLGFNAEFSQ